MRACSPTGGPRRTGPSPPLQAGSTRFRLLAIGRHLPRDQSAPQPAELLAGPPEELDRSAVGLFPRMDDDEPSRRVRMLPRQFAISDVGQVVPELLLRQQQQMIRAVPWCRLFDVQLHDTVLADCDRIDGTGIQDP